MAMYVLQNEELKVSVASAGAELKSALDQKTGREYLWNADPAYWNRTSPVLFPVVGSYKDKTSYYDGKAYTMGQHGFARDMEFTLASSSDTEIWFVLRADETTYEKYPFDFELHCGYSLQGRSILVMWKVVNPTDGKIWFSIGAHPAFNCAMEGWKLRFDTDKDLTVGILSGGVLTDREKTLVLDNGEYPITPDLFDDDALILEHDQTHNVSLIDPEGIKRVEVDFESHLVGIWSPVGKAAPFVCIEPWYGRADRAGFNQKLEEREYGNVLEAGEAFEKSYLITLT